MDFLDQCPVYPASRGLGTARLAPAQAGGRNARFGLALEWMVDPERRKKPLLKEEAQNQVPITSHLPDLTLPELAPGSG
jgi:hypothetical protein